MALRKLKTSTLFQMGAAALALRGALWLLFVRNGPTSDAVDFAQGFLIAIGSALLLMVAWRKGQDRRRHAGPTSS